MMDETQLREAGAAGIHRVVDFLRDPNRDGMTERELKAVDVGLGVAKTAVSYISALNNREAVMLAKRRFEVQYPQLTAGDTEDEDTEE